jgi:acyl-CoA thioester hydrolase
VSEFVWRARVYWEDTDGGGIVYYANYLKFLERARTEWLRSFGRSQSQLLSEEGIAFAVANVNIDYRKPARLDDELSITCIPERVGGTAVNFKQQIYRGTAGDLVAEAQVRVVCLDLSNLRPKRLPDFLIEEILTP